MHEFVPEIDEGIPLPFRVSEAMPELNLREEMEARARTIQFLTNLQNPNVAVNSREDDASLPPVRAYPAAAMAYLAELVREASPALVEDLSDYKHYVINKLVFEAEHAKTSKDRIAALAKLGDVDGVNAFKKRSEHTNLHKPLDELADEFTKTLDALEVPYSVMDVTPEEVDFDASPAEVDSTEEDEAEGG